MTPWVATPFGTDEVDSVAATAKVLLATEVLTMGPWLVFFFRDANVHPETFLFGLLATAADPDAMMSDTLTIAQETHIII